MRRQRNMAQMKEQIITPEKELNKIEISNLSDAEFKTLVVRMLKELSEDLSSIKKIQSKMKDSLIGIKNNYRITTIELYGKWRQSGFLTQMSGQLREAVSHNLKNGLDKQCSHSLNTGSHKLFP